MGCWVNGRGVWGLGFRGCGGTMLRVGDHRGWSWWDSYWRGPYQSRITPLRRPRNNPKYGACGPFFGNLPYVVSGLGFGFAWYCREGLGSKLLPRGLSGIT